MSDCNLYNLRYLSAIGKTYLRYVFLKGDLKRYMILIGLMMVFSCVMMSYARSDKVSIDPAGRFRSISSMSEQQLYDKARQFEKEKNIDSMLIYYNVLYSRYNTDLDTPARKLCAMAQLASATEYYNQFNYSKAMELLLECRRVSEANGFADILADVYRFIGNIYSSHGDFDRGRMFYERSFELSDSIGILSLRLKSLNNLIGVCAFNGSKEDARRYFELLRQTPSHEPIYTYDVYMDGGLIEAGDGKIQKAAANYRRAADWAERKSLGVKYSGAAWSCLAQLYRDVGRTDSALYYLHLNERRAREAGQNDLLAETLRDLTAIYNDIGNPVRARKYQEEYLRLWDEIFNQREFNALKNADFMYELDKSVGTITMLNAQKAQKDLQIKSQVRMLWTLFITTLVVLGLMFVIYRQKRRLWRAYNDLFAKNTANQENEKFYLRRLQELQTQISELQSARYECGDVSEEQTASITSQINLPNCLQQKLERDIMEIMNRTEILCDPDFSINKLTEMVDSNTTYVSRMVNEIYGKNFRTVLNECRIKESMKRLADNVRYGNYTIRAIAESVGYKSQSNFIAVFTRFAGMKPSVYQKMARQHKELSIDF